ncbi:MAG: bifunctional nuclease domain-containing protein [Nanoarchaeota archaeon]
MTRLSVSVILLFIILAGTYYYLNSPRSSNQNIQVEDIEEKEIDGNFESINFTEDPLSLKDFVKMDVSISPGKMILSHNCTGIVMTTTVAKTFSIQRGIENKAEFRPNEHDIFAGVLENFDINVMFIKIRELSNDLYYANIFFKKGDIILNLDAKPSDALAIASRFKAAVYMNRWILEKTGQNVC